MKYPKDDVTFKGKGGAYLNFAVIMDDMKLMMTKSADSDLMDMMFNLRTDLNEKRNLLGHNAAQATDLTIGRAEYLKIMLLKWMMAKDRKGGYYSDPKTSVLGSSDIEQIRRRRTWPEIDLWTSHSPVVFQGRPEKVLNRFKATRKLYIGHTTPGSLIIESIVKSGRTARFFSVKNFSNGRSIMQGNYLILKVCFESDWRSSFTGLAASITITYRVGNTGQRKKKTVFIRGRA